MCPQKIILAVLILITICFKKVSNSNRFNHLIDDVLISDLESDAFLDSMGFLEKYGYPREKVLVTTEDGYIITTIRIPKAGPPVLLVHGVTDSSDEWLVLGPGRSLAYQLSDAGYDVWLFNYRGNRYSKGHAKSLPPKEYWDFSYEEMGTRDAPAVIDHILNVTSRKKLSYIGFSQGTTIFLVMCSMRPEYNDKVQVSILLAPVAWVNYLRHPMINLVSRNIALINFFTNGIGLYELYPFNPSKAYQSVNCHRKFPTSLCNLEYITNYGLINSSYMSPDRMPVIDSHVPAGVSAKNLVHYIQGYRSKTFQRFDYGIKKNMEIYSSKYPPFYNVKLVTAPINMIASDSDWLSHPKDVETLRRKLPNVKRFIRYNESLEFSHLEFVFGTRINSLVNDPVLKILEEDYKDK